MSVKIQINNKEALERLIGDDPELEIKVKESIINGFAKTYLKYIANSEVMDSLIRVIKDDLTSSDYMGMLRLSKTEYFHKWELSKTCKELVNKEVQDAVEGYIEDSIRDFTGNINTLLKSKFDYLAEVVGHKLSEKIAEGIIERKVQERLNKALSITNCKSTEL